MNYQDTRTKYGKFMFNITLRCSKTLMKHMWLYYVLNYTWGLLTTLIGWIALGFVRLFLRKKVVDHGSFGPCKYVMFGNNWGGLSLGTNFFLADNMGESWTLHTKQHEMGHTFQNAIWGPLAIFLIFLPSAGRYWYQRIRKNKGKPTKDYDAIWFEGNASTIGEIYYNDYLVKE